MFGRLFVTAQCYSTNCAECEQVRGGNAAVAQPESLDRHAARSEVERVKTVDSGLVFLRDVLLNKV